MTDILLINENKNDGKLGFYNPVKGKICIGDVSFSKADMENEITIYIESKNHNKNKQFKCSFYDFLIYFFEHEELHAFLKLEYNDKISMALHNVGDIIRELHPEIFIPIEETAPTLSK